MSVKRRIIFWHKNNSQGQSYSYWATRYHKTLELYYPVVRSLGNINLEIVYKFFRADKITIKT